MTSQRVQPERWFRFPFVFATIGGAALLGVAGIGLFHSIRFAASGQLARARVPSDHAENIGSLTRLNSWNPILIRSRRVTYEFNDFDGK